MLGWMLVGQYHPLSELGIAAQPRSRFYYSSVPYHISYSSWIQKYRHPLQEVTILYPSSKSSWFVFAALISFARPLSLEITITLYLYLFMVSMCHVDLNFKSSPSLSLCHTGCPWWRTDSQKQSNLQNSWKSACPSYMCASETGRQNGVKMCRIRLSIVFALVFFIAYRMVARLRIRWAAFHPACHAAQ